MVNKMRRNVLAAGMMLMVALCAKANEKPLDFWDEEKRLFGFAETGKHVDGDLSERLAINYVSKAFDLDHAEKKEGDFSILYTPDKSGMAPIFGFVASLWHNDGWDLTSFDRLHFWLKVIDSNAPKTWGVTLIDNTGRKAAGQIAKANTDGEWQAFYVRLKFLKPQKEFDWSSVALCEFDAEFGKGASVWLDGIRFEGKGRVLGVTEKTVSQRKEEAERSRKRRIEVALRAAAQDESAPLTMAFAMLYLNEDLDKANDIIVRELIKSEESQDGWSLELTPMQCRLYYNFSNRVGRYKGRLKPEVEKQLLESIWRRTYDKNDIFLARQGNTWWMDGSENHDLNAKVCNLVTSRIFMNEPEYKDRFYPDYGFGGGIKYGHAGYYGSNLDEKDRKRGGRANMSDGKRFQASAHYEAWLGFIKKYIRERAERGIFLEYASPIYSKHSLNFLELAYTYCGDENLRSMMHDFLTLYWADWAQVVIDGVRGGPKTRHQNSIGGYGSGAELVSFYMGGAGTPSRWGFWNLFSDYRLPEIVWDMALDREGMGTFVYQSRGIGEEENIWPRPLGVERGLYCDTESRFVRYSYVTPDYVLGTQMDHPAAVHSHLSVVGRWHGMTFAQSEAARIVPFALPADGTGQNQSKQFDLECMFQSVQHERTLVIQQARQYFSVHPDWFPMTPIANKEMGLWFGTDWDRREECAGWIFVQKGNAYGAVRTVLWDEAFEKENSVRGSGTQTLFNGPEDKPTVKISETSFSWNENKSVAKLEDKYAPVIIEAGRKAEYPTLEFFMEDVLDNPLALYKTVVPGYNILVYTGCGEDAKEIVFNAGSPQIPIVGGEYVNYSTPWLFNSPYINSTYKSGKIEIRHGNEVLNLDFSD